MPRYDAVDKLMDRLHEPDLKACGCRDCCRVAVQLSKYDDYIKIRYIPPDTDKGRTHYASSVNAAAQLILDLYFTKGPSIADHPEEEVCL